VPVVATVWLSRYARRDARLSFLRLGLEQRAHEILSQEDTAPQRWAERLAPTRFPDTSGYEVGTAHQAGTGVMSGDLLDVFRLPSGRLCCVVGDVSGHDVEASISALQAKFLLRTYLRRYRDPGQALEELNGQLIDYERPEEFVSLFVAVFDDEAGTVRYASAGHPAGWLCVERAPRALRSTGPLLMMDPASTYRSVELPYRSGDLLVVATDGLFEARVGDQLFGEERVAAVVRRDSDAAVQVLCKTLIDEAVDFSSGPLTDDVTVLAVRRS
jgi:serine phosphatase RsbU (regulator of sigma subunit)